jgi:hypothetical protein
MLCIVLAATDLLVLWNVGITCGAFSQRALRINIWLLPTADGLRSSMPLIMIFYLPKLAFGAVIAIACMKRLVLIVDCWKPCIASTLPQSSNPNNI